MPRVIVFDVNETLLDLRALDPLFEQIFGAASLREQWFAQVLRSAMVATITDTYHDFSVIARDALEITAMRHGIVLTDSQSTDILDRVRHLPPHPDVLDGLGRLRDAGLRLITLTNSPPAVLEAQMHNAGLSGYFERLLSVHPTQKFKPARAPYEHTARQLGVGVGDLRMVAAHDWDVAGAMRAGCAAAFVARPGMVLGPLQEKPDIIGPDLRAVAAQILEKERA
jgi:2-haloacid dehalogenase